MANEITTTLRFSISNGDYNPGIITLSGVQFDQTTLGSDEGVISIGTSEENLPVGDVATSGFLFMRNLDATNFVEFGQDNASTMQEVGKLRAGGGWAFFEVATGETVRLKADTAACKIYYRLLEL